MNERPNPEVAIFAAALELPADQRGAYLDRACAGDAALRGRVEALLRVQDEAGSFFDKLASVTRPTPDEAPATGSSGNIRLPGIPSEKPGDRIGRYKLLQQIGEGGCGVVYMAEQQEPVRRRVALKVIKLGMDTKSVIARFEAERQALALMDHPNIAKVLEAGATETGRPYFVMELVRGMGATWHEARIVCLTEMLRGILTSQSINTARLAARMGGKVQFESHAQRIRRFLAEQDFDWIVIGRLMLRIAGVAGQKKLTVAVDRTNWDFGKTAINFLVISVVVCGIGVPVVWKQLGKKGNSKTGERIDLLERFLKIVPASQITVFLADREFIGSAWFKALQKRRIPYAIRVRNNQFVTLAGGKRIKISALAKDLTNQKPRHWKDVDLDGVPCALSLKRLPDKDLLAVVSFGLKPGADPLETYRQRWAIELCFACLKTKGFDIESTHLRHADRLEKMFAIASMAAAAALAASKNDNKLQTGSRKNPTRKKTTATPLAPSSSAA